jgi:dTDP-L-rhamnose 4-epimerase
MSIYGEGLYRAPDGRTVAGTERDVEQLKRKEWELRTPEGEILEPIGTPETKQPCLSSVYALSKYDQERMCLILGRAYHIPTVALRFFNVYGTRQALSNPYTGVLAIFASRFLNRKPPMIFEDGRQRRDFVSVQDVVRACRLALVVPEAAGEVFNVGSGRHSSIAEIAWRMASILGMEQLEPEITGNHRAGDIRHCFPDMTRAREVLGYTPRIPLEKGLAELAAWLEGQVAVDRVDQARAELEARGLAV